MHALARPDDGSPSGGDDVAEHDRVAGDDGDHQAGRGLVLGGESDASVLGDRCSGLDARVGPSRRGVGIPVRTLGHPGDCLPGEGVV